MFHQFFYKMTMMDEHPINFVKTFQYIEYHTLAR